ncbi:MAG: low molecular weight phosphotyrosine protein phosphatase [Woeseiaceae bacterium]|nr:low molecular weight phosphotyrosine protein phosphatase [Woeseiaceae bacterium]
MMMNEGGPGDDFTFDSAGTHAYHVGEAPDRRSRAAAERRSISLSDIRARRVQDSGFERFDLILAMDEDNHRMLIRQSDSSHHGKIRLCLDYSESREREVPDLYYGGTSGLERVLDLVEDASRGLLKSVRD